MGKSKNNKIYAIAYGFNPNNGEIVRNQIVNTWTECQKYTKGVKGARYKSFASMHDVEIYFRLNERTLKQSELKEKPDGLIAYVDGSFNVGTNKAGMGVVLLNNDRLNLAIGCEVPESITNCCTGNLRQTVGELCSSLKIATTVYNAGCRALTIYHDYEGVALHALGLWHRSSDFAEYYYKQMQELLSNGFDLRFVQVNSHTGDLMNEIVDDLAKKPIAVPSTGAAKKLLNDGRVLEVVNGNVKKNLTDLGYPRDRIQVV